MASMLMLLRCLKKAPSRNQGVYLVCQVEQGVSYTEWRFIGAGLKGACLGQVDGRGIIFKKPSGQSVQ